MEQKFVGLLVGLILFAVGLSSIIWPQKIQTWQVNALTRGGYPSHGYFVFAWQHARTTWTIRIIGAGAIVMACVLFGEVLISFPVSW